MIKAEVYIDDKQTPADHEAVKYSMESTAEMYGVVRHIRIKEMSPRQMGFGDMEKGEIASCEGVKLLYRGGHYSVETKKRIRQYWFAYTAVMGFTEQIGEVLCERMKAKNIKQPGFEDLKAVDPGYEEHAWYHNATEAIKKNK